jgi:hypothetical protein
MFTCGIEGLSERDVWEGIYSRREKPIQEGMHRV